MADDRYSQPVTVEGKRAVVVGGTSGIGRAIALGFAEDGADVVATSRREGAVAETAAELRERGATTAEVTTDVTDADSVSGTLDAATDAMGGVDVLVNSAGAISRLGVPDVTEEEWDRVLDVQLDGVMRTTQAFGNAMDEGAVVNISSLSSRLAMTDIAAYTAAKGGVNAFTRTAAKEYAPDVRVNAIAPGYFITPQNADTYAEGTEKRERIDSRAMMERVGETEELIGAAVYLASDAAAYTTGEVLVVDGGFAVSAL
ncbi:MAG: SDR family NAD(P)-dependent oxidoreductase [Halobacteriaceae archaeon]